MNRAEQIVSILLENEGDDSSKQFMRDVEFVNGGKMIVLDKLELIRDELKDFTGAVVRRTAEIAPKLIEKGIIEPGQTHILAKLITYYLADQQYNPKLWHEKWQRAAKRIFRWIPGNVSWFGSMSNLRD